ncbi:MAG: IPT/TIG domain-containing protein [Burkholderiales bacterium]|nr:IPT/TIG domain-containing protein [Burkholderiales bacterium]
MTAQRNKLFQGRRGLASNWLDQLATRLATPDPVPKQRPPTPRFRSRPLFEGLEGRLLLSADLAPGIPAPLADMSIANTYVAVMAVTVSNAGTTPVDVPTRVNVYASTDAALDSGDTLVGTGLVAAGNLAGGGSRKIEITLASSLVPSLGQYNLLVRTDADNAVAETNENNNVASVGTLRVVDPGTLAASIASAAGPSLNLDSASDTGTVGDRQTNTPVVSLVGSATAGANVTLVGLGLSTTADNQGAYRFSNVNLALGANVLKVRSTSTTGTVSEALRSVVLVETVDAADPAAVGALRQELITYLWGTGSLPTGMPSQVQSNVASPLLGSPIANLARIDKLSIDMPFGFQSIAYFFQPQGTATKLVVVQQGHWNDLDSGGTGTMIRTLVQEGVAVVALQMPGLGPNTGPVLYPHENLAAYDSAGFAALRLFVEPVHTSLNYLLAQKSYDTVAMIGVSGGGWTTVLSAAIDTRISISYQVAGSYPMSFPTGIYPRDWEQAGVHGPLYGEIGYLDLYVMGSVGAGRKQVQALNRIDPVVFDGTDWRVYQPGLSALVASMGGTFLVHQYENVAHTIDDTTSLLLLQDLGIVRVQVSNDGASGYSTTGTWTSWTGQGYGNNVQESRASDAASVATWQFTGLASGQYRVSATWSAYTNRASNAPFSINGGVAVLINQQQAPNDFTANGANWENLGVVNITAGTLSVSLSNVGVNGNVIADAIRIERISDAAPTTVPALAGLSSTSAAAGSPLTLTGVNFGAAQDSGAVRFGTTTAIVSAWSDTQITVVVPTGLSGPVNVTVSTVNGTSNGLPFTPPAVVLIGNDGASGYSTTGTWTSWTGQGYGNNVQESRASDAASVATWQFTGLASGQYRVSATWSAYTNRASNAPFSINGGVAVLINQQQAPNDFTANGANWENLGVVNITAGTLSVSLSNVGVNGNVIADAIRIERISDAAPTDP